MTFTVVMYKGKKRFLSVLQQELWLMYEEYIVTVIEGCTRNLREDDKRGRGLDVICILTPLMLLQEHIPVYLQQRCHELFFSEFKYASGVVAGGFGDLITVYFICKTATNFPFQKTFSTFSSHCLEFGNQRVGCNCHSTWSCRLSFYFCIYVIPVSRI